MNHLNFQAMYISFIHSQDQVGGSVKSMSSRVRLLGSACWFCHCWVILGELFEPSMPHVKRGYYRPSSKGRSENKTSY